MTWISARTERKSVLEAGTGMPELRTNQPVSVIMKESFTPLPEVLGPDPRP